MADIKHEGLRSEKGFISKTPKGLEIKKRMPLTQFFQVYVPFPENRNQTYKLLAKDGGSIEVEVLDHHHHHHMLANSVHVYNNEGKYLYSWQGTLGTDNSKRVEELATFNGEVVLLEEKSEVTSAKMIQSMARDTNATISDISDVRP